MVIRGKLLESLTSEGVAIVRNKVGDAVAEIANQYTEHGIIFFFFLAPLFAYIPIVFANFGL